MCTSQITIRKFLKLMLQIYFYNFIIFIILYFAGYESLTLKSIVPALIPFWGFKHGFISCFLAFYLTIPFWNILIRNMTERHHQLLLFLLLGCYTLLGSLPKFGVTFNYISWFGIIYLIASYIRMYPRAIFEKRSLWGWLSLVSVVLAIGSILFMNHIFSGARYYFVHDSNKFFAVAVAICSFLWFKNMNIKYSRIINAFGAGTFGVLLIHANSNAMRQWLWKDFVDCVGHYSLPLWSLMLYSVGIVLAIFIVCNLIDQLRIATVEKVFFRWYDNKMAVKANKIIAWLTKDNS